MAHPTRSFLAPGARTPSALALLLAVLLAPLTQAAEPPLSPGMEALLARTKIVRSIALCGDEKRRQERGPRDEADLKAVQAGADAKVDSCQLLLGSWHEAGQGVPLDPDKARALYAAAAPTASAAYVALGRLAEQGVGQEIDLQEAFKLYERAASAGSSDGRVALGLLHENGKGLKQDYAKAAEQYRLAAKRGHPEAWQRLDSLQTQHALFTPEQIKADQGVWVNLMYVRFQSSVSNANLFEAFQEARTVRLILQFQAGATRPQVGVKTSSGDEAFDQIVTKRVAALSVPPLPSYITPKPALQFNVPVGYVPAGHVPEKPSDTEDKKTN